MASTGDRDTAELEAQRARLHEQLARVGDFRRGSLVSTYRRCGKSYCACADPDHPGHGPINLLTKSVSGKTVTKVVPDGPALTKVQQEVAHYKQFKTVIDQIVEVNEQICDARPVSALAGTPPEAESKKRGSSRSSRRTSPLR
ncbi:MAG: DUF6788 family protein [Candidatus Dormibacteria bacterium]